jgi:hypothetical protein
VLQLKSKPQLAKEAFTLAKSYKLVRYRSTTYIPADFETGETSVPPDIDRTIWLPLSREDIQQLAAAQFETLFGSDGELSAFDFMVSQNSTLMEKDVTSLLVRTPAGLKELDEAGQLVENTGEFRPNTLMPMLNQDPAEMQRVFDWITEILTPDGEEPYVDETESLLRHLATSLAPGWSAVKYVLLLGEGRNGKSLLLHMLMDVFGRYNVSGVTRQMMSEQKAPVMSLNGKLLNIVFDGSNEYIKDSGAEKSLVAGESIEIEAKYKNSPVTVETTALFLEGLNREPKTHDKSSALQKRLVRFAFPNVYAKSIPFEKRMRRKDSLGAFLALLIERYVKEDELATALAPTARTMELQLDQMFNNSPALQFLKWLEEVDPVGSSCLLGAPMEELVQRFRSWRLKENDLGTWADPDVAALFGPLLTTERKSERTPTGPRKIRKITSFKPEAQAFLDSLKGDDDAALLNALVED